MSKNQQTKYHIRKRMFLNRDLEMRAFIIGIVENTCDIPDEDENAWKWGKIELTLADCNRSVSYDFNMDSKADRAASLYKIRRISEVVNAFREALETEAVSMAERERKKPKVIEKPKAKAASG